MDKVANICIDHIAPFRDRERDPERFKMLVESIREHGLIEPIVVAPAVAGERKKYRLVAGHGRLRAAKKLGWQKINAVLREKFNVSDFIVENWRKELSPYEAAVLVDLELRMGRPKNEVAKKFSVTLPVIEQYIGIIRHLHPELQALVKKRAMTLKDAHSIVKKLPEQKAQETLIQTIRRVEQEAPSNSAVKVAVNDVLGAVKLKGGSQSIDSVEKVERIREEVKGELDETNEALRVVRSHWFKSVGELRLLLKDANYRKLFDRHGIDYSAVVS